MGLHGKKQRSMFNHLSENTFLPPTSTSSGTVFRSQRSHGSSRTYRSHTRRSSSTVNPAHRRRTPRPPPSAHQQTFQLQPSLTIILNARYVTYHNMCSAPRPPFQPAHKPSNHLLSSLFVKTGRPVLTWCLQPCL